MQKENLVIYQIYPRSYKDSNGDGIGDIKGIIEKLDYIKNLGVDGIWLSPINTSPMYDFGYDISDYRGIDPVFGSLSDCDELISECHKRGILVMMDLVLNHTSHLHPWFLESQSSKNNPKRDWYIWHPGKHNFFTKLLGLKPKAPNNWLAVFGGKAWQWDKETKEYYLHSFLVEQPDINWRNAEVKKAVFDEIEFWLKKGVDGFRLDVVNFFVKDEKLRNNPFAIGKTPRPYDLQKHIYDRNRPELNDILKEFRQLLDKYENTLSVGEVYSENGAPKMSASTLGNGKDQLHLAFDFSLIYTKFCAAAFHTKLKNWFDAIPKDGTACHVFSNHDQSRSKSRYGEKGKEDNRARIVAMLSLCLKGVVFVYYGEEIGMIDGKVKRTEMVDPVGKMYWPFHPGRDPERTPMQWDRSPNAGFSTHKPWLPVNKNHKTVNVDAQEKDPHSLLNFYRKLIALRKHEPALVNGEIELLPSDSSVLCFTRKNGEEMLLITLNFTNKKAVYSNLASLKNKKLVSVFSTLKTENSEQTIQNSIALNPYEGSIWRII
jgi:alpha-glucosidase